MRKLLADGLALFAAGRLAEADAACEQLLLLVKTQADALHLKALILNAEGRYADALSKVDRALAGTRSVAFLATRGQILRALGRVEEAIRCLQQAVDLNPLLPELRLQLAWMQYKAGAADAALDNVRLSVAQSPGLATAQNILGVLLMARQDVAGAERAWREAVALQPTLAEAWANLGVACMQLRKVDESLQAYRQALAVAPEFVVALDGLAATLSRAGRYEEAQSAAQAALALQPDAQRAIQAALMLPVVPVSMGEMLAARSRFENELERLAATLSPVDEITAKVFCADLFYLAYHALNDLELRVKISRFYERLYPGLRFQAPHIDREPEAGRRRIGFFSAFLHDHPVAHCFAALIDRMSEDTRLEVFLISPAIGQTGAMEMFAGFCGTCVSVQSDYLPARARIADLELDVLVYLDIGMESLSYFLAHARLAHVQCVIGGHPETTGIAAVDHFLSTDSAEPPDAQLHYAENLVRMPTAMVLFRHPELPAQFKSRVELGLPEEGHLYICPMMLQKLHPDFDVAIEGILRADAEGHVILFEHRFLPWRARLEKRLQSSISAELQSRIHFLPWILDKADFLAVNAHASVVLDPFHFGIGSTAISTFAVDTPIVTWPGEFMRGRVGFYYCRHLGLEDCIASDHQDYVERAVAIASDPLRRGALSEIIKRNKHRFYDDGQVVDDLADFLISLQPIELKPLAIA